MIDPEHVRMDRIEVMRRDAIEHLSVFYEPRVITSIGACIVKYVREGRVGEGITYADLVRQAGTPSWLAHATLLGYVLTLVSLESYERDGILLSALTCTKRDLPAPSSGFCGFLENLGLVTSRHQREECLETWDYHWKKAVSQLESDASGPAIPFP